ncbi:hypothetical protein OS493_018619 [Desmophyllum pertusum]|uniref:protein disulfide-isomerase n=1 Tax=Desmophyllum pertusum TaxID=174260 RepID=A0A9W9ZNF6_9CNID|nr:hypothetical protein OS493_018619 [Desmophyllum pertusum]
MISQVLNFIPLGCGHCKSLAPTYEKLGEAFGKVDDVVIAKVDADADKDLNSRFGISGFPTLKYFSKGSTSAEEYSGGRDIKDLVSFIEGKTSLASVAFLPLNSSPRTIKDGEEYNGGRSEQDFIDFLNEKCKTNRVSGGGISGEAGRIEKFDAFAKDFMANEDKRDAILEEAKSLIEAQDNPKVATYYTKVMERVQSKGDAFITTEIDRLERLLGGDISTTKKDEFSVRHNILKQFDTTN